MRSKLHVLGWLALVLGIGAIASVSCSRKPNEPQAERYAVYAGSSGYLENSGTPGTLVHRIYIYDTDSLQLQDSIITQKYVEDIEVSPDGCWLYIEVDGLQKIDTRTKQGVWSLTELGGGHQLLKNGELIVRDEFENFAIRRASDGGLIRNLPDTLNYHHGPVGGTKIAAETHGPVRHLFVHDLETGESDGNWMPVLSDGGVISPRFAVLHPDGRRILAIGPRGFIQNSWFVVGDVLTGETLLEHHLTYPFGEITISEDGLTAVVTDPSRVLIHDSDETMDIFDLKEMLHVYRFGGMDGNWIIAGQAEFLPDGDRMLTGPRPFLGVGTGPMYEILLTSLSIADTIWSPLETHPFTGAASAGSLAVGRWR